MKNPSDSTHHLYLIRHGRTALNAEGRLRGLADPPLDEVGVHEAEDVAVTLVAHSLTEVVSSPLQRARQTARIIAMASAVPHRVDHRLIDRDYGPHTGSRKTDVERRWGSVDAAPGVEPAALVLRRVTAVLTDIIGSTNAKAVAVVTHDALIRPFIASIEEHPAEHEISTGSWHWIRRRDGQWQIVALDQTSSAGVRVAADARVNRDRPRRTTPTGD